MQVTLVATGVANLASVQAAFARLGCTLKPVRTAQDITRAAALLLPGVGHFGAARQALDAAGFASALHLRMRQGRPTLGICLGMQLCCDGSDEDPTAPGLGLVPGRTRRFDAVRCPQMGWNAVVAPADATLLASGHAYFANSYRLATAPPGWSVATASHGGTFVAALERDAVLLCQFHPELSGAFGHDLLQRWLDRARTTVPC